MHPLGSEGGLYWWRESECAGGGGDSGGHGVGDGESSGRSAKLGGVGC
jgi:hypothetical protein